MFIYDNNNHLTTNIQLNQTQEDICLSLMLIIKIIWCAGFVFLISLFLGQCDPYMLWLNLSFCALAIVVLYTSNIRNNSISAIVVLSISFVFFCSVLIEILILRHALINKHVIILYIFWIFYIIPFSIALQDVQHSILLAIYLLLLYFSIFALVQVIIFVDVRQNIGLQVVMNLLSFAVGTFLSGLYINSYKTIYNGDNIPNKTLFLSHKSWFFIVMGLVILLSCWVEIEIILFHNIMKILPLLTLLSSLIVSNLTFVQQLLQFSSLIPNIPQNQMNI